MSDVFKRGDLVTYDGAWSGGRFDVLSEGSLGVVVKAYWTDSYDVQWITGQAQLRCIAGPFRSFALRHYKPPVEVK